MPLSTAAKLALCVCPPAMMAGAVATVPAVKRAVHHATAKSNAPRQAPRTAASSPAGPAVKGVDCPPIAGAVPAVPLVTFADPIPDEPGGPGGGGGVIGGGGVGPVVGAIGGGGSTPTIPVVTPTPTPPVTGAVPEPATWFMMIGGVGSVGLMLRRRRRVAGERTGVRIGGRKAKAAAGMTLWSGSAAVEAGDMAATVAVKSALASTAGKVMMCVCPAVVAASSVVAVPPLRQAVHAATAAPAVVAPIATSAATVPCEPVTVPVSAAAVEGFPATVTTVTTTIAASAAVVAPVRNVAIAVMPAANSAI